MAVLWLVCGFEVSCLIPGKSYRKKVDQIFCFGFSFLGRSGSAFQRWLKECLNFTWSSWISCVCPTQFVSSRGTTKASDCLGRPWDWLGDPTLKWLSAYARHSHPLSPIKVTPACSDWWLLVLRHLLIIVNTISGDKHHPHFTHTETEAQKTYVTWLKSHCYK